MLAKIIKKFVFQYLTKINQQQDIVLFCRQCEKNNVIDGSTLKMLEGVVGVSEQQVRDTMVPRAQMVCLHYQHTLADILPIIITSKHSRFPVLGEHEDEIVGLLLAKDLLRFVAHKHDNFDIKALMHPPFFVPESKRLSKLLETFQMNHTHLAIVVDEYGGVAGLVTIEDALEEIVGEIEDEHFVDQGADYIKKVSTGQYIIQALTPIETLNKSLALNIQCDHFDTLGGYIAQQFGYLPKVGEHITLFNYQFTVLHADQRRIRLFEVELVGQDESKHADK
jgi:magnesium and cobalt transporter